MKQYQAADIRNIALAGHGGSGKTAFVEAALQATGVIDRMGRSDQGILFWTLMLKRYDVA